MTILGLFPPTIGEVRLRIDAVNPADYARTRNELEGAVTRLSPYLTHGFVSVPEVLEGVAARHDLHLQQKFVVELGWREYFQHVWQQRGNGIMQSLHETLLPESAYSVELPADIREARTGVPVIDQAVRTLYADGYLHNHARLWLASYVVHLRKVHWRAGADWLFAHLIDGDLASNHLSWQWVAGTGSSKPYLFNSENVARFAPQAWQSAGTVLDTSYEQLDAIARNTRPIPQHSSRDGVNEPALHSTPPQYDSGQAFNVHGDSAVRNGGSGNLAALNTTGRDVGTLAVANRDVWLVHPWSVGEPPADIPANCMHVGWWPMEFHMARPWSATRWTFVGSRMSALAAVQFYCTSEQLHRALITARSVQTYRNLHIDALMPSLVIQRVPLKLFAEVDRLSASFSSWWKRSTRGVKQLSDLPGMRALSTRSATQ